jgi:hypothetical protein
MVMVIGWAILEATNHGDKKGMSLPHFTRIFSEKHRILTSSASTCAALFEFLHQAIKSSLSLGARRLISEGCS